MPDKASALVLLSGGLDSATVLAWTVQKAGHRVHALSFAYGQRHKVELDKARQLAQHYNCQHTIFTLAPQLFAVTNDPNASSLILQDTRLDSDNVKFTDAPWRRARQTEAKQPNDGIPATYVPARNIIFLAHALAFAETQSIGHIFLGINAIDYAGYPDCRPEFLSAFQKMARLGTRTGAQGRAIQIEAPLLHLTKKEIIAEGLALGLNYALTSSCYEPNAAGQPCQTCDSCRLRQQGFTELGVVDPLLAC